jgi:2'-5' RNA ligase
MQLRLGLAESPPPRRSDRLFFALVPEPLVARRIHRLASGLRRDLGLSGALIPPERLHVSLYGLDDHAGLPAGLVEAARDAAGRVSEVAFEVAFDRLMSFSGNGAVVLVASDNMPEIRRFWESLGFAMEATPLAPYAKAAADNALTPHMTLLYDHDVIVPKREILPIRWRVSDFVLVHSRLGQGRHVYLGRWSLH